jgi:hypothetical protein
MRFLKGVVLIGLISLLVGPICPSLSYAEQPQGTAPTFTASAEDNVVRTDEAGPFVLAHWRPSYRTGWYGRPHSRWYYRVPYYYKVYPSVRCWWNGSRWVCPYKYKKYWL